MTIPAELERKVRRLDNDVQAIYELLAGISATQQRHGNRLNELDGRLTDMDGRLMTMDGRLTTMDGRLTDLDGRLTDLDGKLDVIVGLLRGDGQ
jgi:chromosome segregation ATPase